jgi:TPR repeat protein
MHECAICMEVCSDVHWLQCKHGFHAKCVRKLIAYGGETCPLCRSPLASDLNETYSVLMMKYDHWATRQSDRRHVFANLLELAEAGCVAAQHDVGVLYLNGEGVEQSLDDGLKWIRLAATQNFSLAQHRLGVIYSLGIGVKVNEFKARSWFLKAGRAH